MIARVASLHVETCNPAWDLDILFQRFLSDIPPDKTPRTLLPRHFPTGTISLKHFPPNTSFSSPKLRPDQLSYTARRLLVAYALRYRWTVDARMSIGL